MRENGMKLAPVEPNIEKLTPYVPGKSIDELKRELGLSKVVKLASNENPFGPSPKAIERLGQILSTLNIYPDGSAYEFKQALAKHLDVSPAELLVSNGSNEAIELVVRTFRRPECEAVLSKHSFIIYRIACVAAGVKTIEVPMTESLCFDLDAIAAAVTPKTRFVFIANPNNPTGTYVSREALERFLDRLSPEVIVGLDEAYSEYVDRSDYPDGIELQKSYPNLVVMRTFSKCYGLAGLRVGYAVAAPKMINYLDRVRAPFNVSVPGQEAARVALSDQGFVSRSVAHNLEERAYLSSGLRDLGLEVTDSVANFVLVKLPRPAIEVFKALLTKGVIIRPMAGYDLPNHARISVGLRDEIDMLLAALREVLQ